MSGGYFDYAQHDISRIAEDVRGLIENNNSEELNSYGDKIGRNYSPEIVAHFRDAVLALEVAYIYAQRIDWLVSCDDGPESFLRRLKSELEVCKRDN